MGRGALRDDTKNGCVADYVSIHDIPCHQWQLIGNRVGFSSEESDLRDWRGGGGGWGGGHCVTTLKTAV